MPRLTLFSLGAQDPSLSADSCRPDPDSESLLATFEDMRLAQGAHTQSVRRELSQIRALMREAGTQSQPVALRDLIAAPFLIARALTEPATPIARSMGRARLLAIQRFMTVMGRSLGRNLMADLAALDTLLPGRGERRT